VREYYEDLWQRLSDSLKPPEFDLRRDFLAAELKPEDRLLDLGCGAGEFTAIASDLGAEAVGVEVAQSALERARGRHPQIDFRFAQIDGPLSLEDNSFDVVWASEVIEHVADTARWLSEIRRVLVPRGRLLLTTPSHGRVRLVLGGIERFSEPLGDHLHLYTRRSLTQTLRELGWGEVSVRAAGGPPLLRRMLMARAVR
jgi:SAM-dependent methyltransferase